MGFAPFVNDALTGRSSTIETAQVGNVGALHTNTYDTQSPGVGFQGVVGYMVNEIISFEVKYSQTVWPNKFFFRAIDKPDDPFFLNNELDFKLHQISFGPSTLIAIPITKYFAPCFKGGISTYRHKRLKAYNPKYTQPTTATLSSSFWDIRFLIGYGIRSQITESFGVRLEYECAMNPTISKSGKVTQGNLNLLTYFSF